MMTAAPRRRYALATASILDLLDDELGIDLDTILPRRSRPQRAVHCLTTHTCMGCPDDEHQRTWAEFEQAPRRAEDAPCAA